MSVTEGCNKVTLELTEAEQLQVWLGLDARIEELDRLIEANRGYDDAAAQVEDWERQRQIARAVLRMVQSL